MRSTNHIYYLNFSSSSFFFLKEKEWKIKVAKNEYIWKLQVLQDVQKLRGLSILHCLYYTHVFMFIYICVCDCLYFLDCF